MRKARYLPFSPSDGFSPPAGGLTPASVPGLSSCGRSMEEQRLQAALGALDYAALAGVSVLLVAHQWAVVMQDLHGMFPVPAGATEVLEADLGRGIGGRGRRQRVNVGVERRPFVSSHEKRNLGWFGTLDKPCILCCVCSLSEQNQTL